MSNNTYVDRYNQLSRAMFSNAFPCNPVPFAQGLADYVKANGTASITSDEARAMLWVLMAQCHGQLANIDLVHEWQELNEKMNNDEDT